MVDRPEKGDRLVRAELSRIAITAAATFATRWDAQDAVPEKPGAPGVERKVLIGCDRAFGSLVRGNFSGRCLASGAELTATASIE
jgi:hypothetical protein